MGVHFSNKTISFCFTSVNIVHTEPSFERNSFTLTGFDNSPANRGLMGFTFLNSGMHMTMQRCFWGLRFCCLENDLE